MKPHSLGWKIQTAVRSALGIPRDMKILGDQDADQAEHLAKIEKLLREAIEQLNRTTAALMDAYGRLAFYEQSVESLRFARYRYDQHAAKEIQ